MAELQLYKTADCANYTDLAHEFSPVLPFWAGHDRPLVAADHVRMFHLAVSSTAESTPHLQPPDTSVSRENKLSPQENGDSSLEPTNGDRQIHVVTGGGSGKEEKKVSGEALGAGSAGGGGIKPVAIIVADKDGVRVEPIKRGGTASVVEKVGEVLGKIAEKRGEKKAE